MLINLVAFPYDSEIIRYESDGSPVFDRDVDSKIYRKLFLKYFTEGVFPNPSTNFQLVENSTQGALVKKGWANVRGVLIELEQDTAITFEPADNMDRIDRVVLRHDDTKSVRKPDVIILKGSPSNSPVPQEIVRDETQWDIVLADVRIRKNSSVITNAQIDDKRLDSELCGIIRGTVEEIDTATLYKQIQSDLMQFKENEQAEFVEWFETIKGILDGDAAGNLQNQVDDLKANKSKVTDAEDNVILEVPMTAPKSHIKNGDFQINTRGKTSYTSTGYGLDMWHFVATASNPISPIKGGGILINKATPNQNVVRQFDDTVSKNDVGKEYTLVVNIETDKEFVGTIGLGKQRQNIEVEVGNKFYYHTFTLTESDFEDRNNLDILVLNADDRVTNSPQIKIYYADLFDGNIVYKHQKEDYANALMRCQQNLYVVNNVRLNIPILVGQTSAFIAIPMPTQLLNNPVVSITDNKIGYYLDNGSGIIEKTFEKVGTITINNNFITIELIGSFGNAQWRIAMLSKVGLIISCEPL